jgi:hypothetical protein
MAAENIGKKIKVAISRHVLKTDLLYLSQLRISSVFVTQNASVAFF